MTVFVIRAGAAPEFLGRVVLLFHRLGIEIICLIFERAQEEAHVEIWVHCSWAMTQRIEGNLHKLVDVVSVEVRGPNQDSGQEPPVVPIRPRPFLVI